MFPKSNHQTKQGARSSYRYQGQASGLFLEMIGQHEEYAVAGLIFWGRLIGSFHHRPISLEPKSVEIDMSERFDQMGVAVKTQDRHIRRGL